MTGASPSTATVPTPGAERRATRHEGAQCRMASLILLVLGLVLLVFGWFYLLEPAESVSSIQSIAVAIGLHTTVPPSEPSGAFYGWVGFTFAYMMAATACCFLAASPTPQRMGYLNILLVLKGTSSMTGLVFFLALDPYAFYLSTFLVDGLLFLLVFWLRRHLSSFHEGSPSSGEDREGTAPA